ncbi:cysteinyl-tRNA synthetase [Methylacidimicrobium cyclopophantes]|uniref:Cysteine--tRNA ligase n=1 Tax=Methylacidimicrobium cyclopophantes TaxID=1041766 RepID=A0A5E6MAM0_9BACT|nr:cysteine--tRNA ligase [Methylacidimicrobium cyclopophantes]VVM06445.1 cysteinyl-tRNA synthetase [Methylacidimicrobium cyclopophantes]
MTHCQTPLRLFNTLSRSVEEFRPMASPKVRLYACGPTVYGRAHIGNFRTFLFVDLLRRVLVLFGFEPEHVMNYTDVDDKTIAAAKAASLPLREFTNQYIALFEEDLKTLRILPPDRRPRATDHIELMIALIEDLIRKGHAYVGEDGSVYFRIASFPDYGKLAHLDRRGLQPGARIAQDEYVKESVGDFALWKAWKAEDGGVGWASPWGKGRPGWHIECSAMSMHYLGQEFDIHCGGADLIFPHHENEIAQSCCATGKAFVRTWLHCSHVLVDGEKMSKSLGNVYSVADVLAKGYTGRHLRFLLLTASHYRQTLNFTWEGLAAAKAAVDRIDDWLARWRRLPPTRFAASAPEGEAFLASFCASLADDLNISDAVGRFFDFLRATNRAMDLGTLLPDLPSIWEIVDSVLGLGTVGPIEALRPPSAHPNAEAVILAGETPPLRVQELLARRAAARSRRDWKESDSLRKAIEEQGWTVRDTPEGQELRRR